MTFIFDLLIEITGIICFISIIYFTIEIIKDYKNKKIIQEKRLSQIEKDILEIKEQLKEGK